MRYYKSFILFSLLALVFVACDTDDLEKDIDALKDRVASVEAQVQRLNDEMNILRVALDGNKTITNYSINGDTYTLTLSNGETLTLTQGEVGDNYPSIDISEDGYWVIAGNKTEWRAKAKDGEDATITPQFKIDENPDADGKKYWWVSYDDSTWKVLENGLAEGENNNPPLINKVEVKDGYFNVTIGEQVYQIPVVEGLECAINAEGLVDGLWTIAGGVEASFSVKVNLADGDLVRVNAPADWNAKVSEYSAGATDVTVTLTPPITPSECTIVVEVTRGVNTASDQIKAKTISDSYWAEYQAGFDIKIGDVVINKFDYPNAELKGDGEEITAEGIYFIAKGAMVSLPNNSLKNLILIAENKSEHSKLITSSDKLSVEVNLLCKGIHLSGKTTRNYWFNLGGSKIIERLYFEECEIEIPDGKSFTYFSLGVGIKNFMINSCRISMSGYTETKALTFLALYTKTYSDITIKNNIFYCRTAGTYTNCTLMSLTAGQGNIDGNVVFDNNTFMNIFNHQNNYYVQVEFESGWSMKRNLVWYDNGAQGTTKAFISKAKDADKLNIINEDFAGNHVFTSLASSSIKLWKPFNSTPNPEFHNEIEMNLGTIPFEAGFSASEGKYTLKPEYQGIGATIE
ncbi:PL29 family lyase N-terminal domain-containing protein [Bacteroides finegoldii]|uniref:PL29 family lyase N-terminal domain-containing protein n=1 Tax=Bacteroides finegoldii TaxID=338188 RepID=UPI00189D9E73|nr:PL29 family lyase N-terminal domain-containing protein [Bacteroides finegoldii]